MLAKDILEYICMYTREANEDEQKRKELPKIAASLGERC